MSVSSFLTVSKDPSGSDMKLRGPWIVVVLGLPFLVAVIVLVHLQNPEWEREAREAEMERVERVPRVVLLAHDGESEADWLARVLNKTQVVSKESKVCFLGHLGSFSEDDQRVKDARRRFYMKLAEFDVFSDKSRREWVGFVNDALSGGLGSDNQGEASCDSATQFLLLGVPLVDDFPLSNISAQDSIWFETFSQKLRDSGAKIIKISRYDVLRRAVEVTASDDEDLDMDLLLTEARKFDQGNLQLGIAVRRIQVPSLSVFYEELDSEFDSGMDAVFRFLEAPTDFDVRTLQLPSGFSGVSPGQLPSEKCSKLRAYFCPTEFAGLVNRQCGRPCPRGE